VEIRVLGTIELWANGQSHALVSTKLRMVLACLAYEVGRPVPADTLVDRLWDDGAPPQGRASLRPYISRLRRTLQSAASGPGGPTVRNQDHAYVLKADPRSVDLHRYRSLAAQARSLADSGDDEQALRLAEQADQLWRGEPLTGLPGLWAEQIRTALAHESLAVALIRADISLRRGHFADIAGYLSSLAAQHPTDEALAERLMLALYGCGRTIDALRAFHGIRRRLVDDVASEPGQRLQQVHEGVLRNASITSLVPGGTSASSASASTALQQFAAAPPNNLPNRDPLIGRENDIALVRNSLTHRQGDSTVGVLVSLEAIAGMAGVGKSALAVHVAYELRDRFPDGQLYIELGAHAGEQAPMAPATALDRLLRILGVPAQRIPQDLEGATAMWRTLLASRRVLIVLDDAADPDQVRPLLPGSHSSSLVITTSRRRLMGLPGQRHISLDVLSEDDAVALFRERVGEERTRDTREVAEVVRLCGHLPLAIQITASRLNSRPAWSTADLAQRLATSDQRLAEIRNSSGGIARIFEFSYRGLDGAQQTAFRRLGLHIGSEFGPHAAAALSGMSLRETESVLEDLLDYYLIHEPSAHRYRIHDLLREYARMLATAEEPEHESALAVDRLLDFYLDAADRADRLLYPHRPRLDIRISHIPNAPLTWRDRSAARHWLGMERASLLAAAERAWDIGSSDRAALFANALGGFLAAERHGPIEESLHQRAVSHWRSTDDRQAESRALIDLALTHTHAGRYASAITAAERALALARATSDDAATVEALLQLATPRRNLGEFKTALALEREALDISTRTGDTHQQAHARNNTAVTLLNLGQYRDSLASFQTALSGLRASGDESGQAAVLNNMGDLHSRAGAHDKARRSYERALGIATTNGNLVDRAIMQMNLATSLQTSNELDAALNLYRESLSTFRRVGERRRELLSLNGIGTVFRLTARHDEALAHHHRALEIARDIGAAPEEAQVLIQLGLTERLLGRSTVAASHVRLALTIAERIQAVNEMTKAQQILATFR
jgi:DNA-binding SARP family transcriptional activator/tetratricopeptide (TPR) repeat protein